MILTNFLKETELVLKNHQLTWNAVKAVRNSTGYIPLAQFVQEAANITYDADFGEVYIDPTLKIIGGSWWLERGNYDGKEGWVYCRKPEIPSVPATDYHLTVDHLSQAEIAASEFERRMEIFRTA